MSISLVGEGERADLRSIGSADGDGIARDCRRGEKSGRGDGADGASSAGRFASKRRAEGGGVFAGDDFWGEMDLARSVNIVVYGQPVVVTAARIVTRIMILSLQATAKTGWAQFVSMSSAGQDKWPGQGRLS